MNAYINIFQIRYLWLTQIEGQKSSTKETTKQANKLLRETELTWMATIIKKQYKTKLKQRKKH